MERISTSSADAWLARGTDRGLGRRWGGLVAVAVGGSLLFGASLSLVLTDWNMVAAALWLALSAGLAWSVFIPVLCWVGKLRLAPCIDACLATMAYGEMVLTLGALMNGGLWWRGATAHAVGLNVTVVAISNVVMALALSRRLRLQGVPPGRVWAAWMAVLNGSGAAFFFLLYQWLHRA